MIFRFADPWLLVLLIVPLGLLLWRERRAGAQFSGFAVAAMVLRPSRGPLVFRILMALGLACLVVAAARPQYGHSISERSQDGRDLMLVIDLSGSMQVDDLTDAKGERSDRLAAVFSAARGFIEKRPNDRIGLVFFSTTALTSCPLTYDHATVVQFLERTEKQQRALWNKGQEEGLLGGATNIGLGLASALKRLRDAGAKGRATVLITDGADTRNLPGWVDPIAAAKRSADEHVTVYGIGVGNPDGTMTRRDGWGRVRASRIPAELLPDMSRLETIAKAGAGRAFAANDQKALADVFSRIDALEPTPRSVTTRDDFSDRFHWPLTLGVLLLALALTLEVRLRGEA
jgi:Ca-activated chloride channel family protein